MDTPSARIASALESFLQPTSRLHRDIRARLLELQSSHQRLDGLFQRRRAQRQEAVAAFTARAAGADGALLADLRTAHARNLALGDPQLVSISASQIRFEEQKALAARDQVAAFEAATRAEDATDEARAAWMARLVVHAVGTLRDDTSLEQAIAIASAGLIVAGVAGGPAVAVGAAAASAALLLREVKENLGDRSRATRRDRERARDEAASEVLGIVAQLSAQWVAILEAHQ